MRGKPWDQALRGNPTKRGRCEGNREVKQVDTVASGVLGPRRFWGSAEAKQRVGGANGSSMQGV